MTATVVELKPHDMVARVARRLRLVRWERSGSAHAHVDALPLMDTDLRDARAAIKEMRNPTWPMLDAGLARSEAVPGEIWQAMIDAALRP
jgi:hypothetical protein